MAQRDRSQGFGFVYVDIAKLLAKRDDGTHESVPTASSSEAQVINFNKDPQVRAAAAVEAENAPTATTNPQSVRERLNAMQQLRGNLDRLQSLHHKLHAMLEELNTLTNDKKKV